MVSRMSQRAPGAARGQAAHPGDKVQLTGLQGVVVRGHSNIHQVAVGANRVECYLRGGLRRHGPVVVGDRVRVSLLEGGRGVIEEVLARHSLLERPPVANVEQVVMVFTLRQPIWNQVVLDRLLVAAEIQQLPVVLCLNKWDLVAEDPSPIVAPYRAAGYAVVLASALEMRGTRELAGHLAGKVSVLSGASGVGKSSLLNAVAGTEVLTGEVGSIGRGRHTTRRVELFPLPGGGFAADTPGFTAMALGEVQPAELGSWYPEFRPLLERCRFRGCLHRKEPGCAVREAREREELDAGRYERYLKILEEVEGQRHRY